MATILPTSVPTKRLATSLNASSTGFTLNNIKGWNGSDLTSADFGTTAYGVFRNPENTVIELFEWDPSTIASATITITRRGLKFTGDLTTEVTANKLTWVRNETLVELGSDAPQLLNNFVDLGRSQTITGVKTFSAVPASTAAPVSGNDLANKTYVDGVVSGGAISHDQEIVAGTAGETVSAGQLLYFDLADNEWKKCDADTAASVNVVKLGIAQGAGTDGNAISGGVLLSGIDTNQSGMTQGDLMYAGNTAGAISSSTGTTERVIGIARTATNLYFDPYFYYIPTAAQKAALPTADEKAAMAGTSGTPSSTNKFVTDDDPLYAGATVNKKSLNAGATINGATLPVPVYQNKTDNEVYACDANDTAAYKFIGFATSNSTDGNPITVQFNGVVSGFSALDEGEKYYVQDTVGTIGTTPGTQEILVGVAISTTELVIVKGRMRATGAGTQPGTASGTQAVTTGFRPSMIRLVAGSYTSGSSAVARMEAFWTPSTMRGIATLVIGTGANNFAVNAARLYSADKNDNYMTYAITNVTDTGFTIEWTETGAFSTSDAHVVWYAEGEL